MATSSNAAEEVWLGPDGARIFVRHWPAVGTPRASLAICHGVNSHGGQYIRAAEAFAAAGFAVTALDLRGRGKSDGERFYVESVDDYVSDLSQSIEFARSKHPELPVFLLGHSAGGVTSVTYALDYQDRIAGLICESFAFRVYAPNFALKLLEGASHFVPHAHVLRLKMEDFSRDAEWVAALNADPNLRWGNGQLATTDIPAYVATLTSLVLLADTVVTMYRGRQVRTVKPTDVTSHELVRDITHPDDEAA